MDGPGESYSEDGHLKSRGTYKSGKEDGLWEGYYSDGQLESKLLYRDGKIQGLLEMYYENGQLKEKSYFRDGVMDGPSEYHYNQEIFSMEGMKGTYKDGVQCGEWSEYGVTFTYDPC